MFKQSMLLAACLLAWTGTAGAQQPCGPVTVIVPSGVEFAASLVPCAPFAAGFGDIRCSNCAAIQEYTPERAPAMCVRHTQGYALLTLRRHLVNGKCVPEEATLQRQRDLAQHAPAASLPPRAAAPPIAPPRAAPGPIAAPLAAPLRLAAPRVAPIAPPVRPVDSPRSSPGKP